MTAGGKRKGAGRPLVNDGREKWTAPMTIRVPPTSLAEFKKAAAAIGMSFTDYVYSAVYERTEDVKALPADAKKRQRKYRTMRDKMLAAVERGDDATANRIDAVIDQLEEEAFDE